MPSLGRRVIAVAALGAGLTLAAAASGRGPARALDASAPQGVAPSGMVSPDRPRLIASLASAADIAVPAASADTFVDRPGMPLAAYRRAKAAATSPPQRTASGPLSSNTLQGHAALSVESAAGEGNVFPPGINGAVGPNQVVTVTNRHISVYSKSASTPTLLAQKTLNTLVNYSDSQLFDPRIEYDTRWNRWVFLSNSFEAPSNGPQWVWLAVSQTSDATGSWTVIPFGLGSSTVFVDYPQLGLSQDALIVTYNTFNSGSQTGALTFALAKAIFYNGQGTSTPVFPVGSSGTVTPPNVIDTSPRVHELLEVPNSAVYNVFFNNPANAAYASIQSITAIAGVDVTVPPDAPQPGACGATSCAIDTGDARFVNDATQYGTELWAVNTVGAGGTATPHWYDLWAEGASKNTVRQGGTVHADPTSNDWNASLVARDGGRAMMTWSYDDVGLNVNPAMAMTGRLASDPAGSMNAATNVFTSAHNLQGNYDASVGAQRWGYTSSIRYDPGTARTFGFNETVSADGTAWGTHQGVLSLS